MADPPLVFHPDARIDALAAYDWYFQRSPHAAEAFQNELREAGLAIQRSPER